MSQKYPIVKVSITRTKKIRAKIKENKKEGWYEVTVGGISWRSGKGVQHSREIKRKVSNTMCAVRFQFDEHLNND